jgi:ferrous iron transport protein B
MKIATLGNPNSGKTTLFNGLTGSRQKVGNFSGVTVDKKVGHFTIGQQSVELIDLPGIYNLDPHQAVGSVDEQVVYDYLHENPVDLVINVVDAATLERSLYLSVQLKEMGLPVLLVINKIDTAEAQNLAFNLEKLGALLQMPVTSISATQGRDVNRLKDLLITFAAQAKEQKPLYVDYGEKINPVLERLLALSEQQLTPGLGLRLLECVRVEGVCLSPEATDEAAQLVNHLQADMDVDLALADGRYSFIYQATQQSVKVKGKLGKSATDRLDTVMLHPVLGIPIFLGMMYMMFLFAINGGGAFIDFFDIAAGTVFVDGVAQLLGGLGSPEWLTVLLADGVGGGIQTVATFIPVIAFLYLFLSILDSSGYLARAAFVVDKAMQGLGLPGKAFVPMLMGFGCTVPAVMAARVLERERERILTASMSPFMSCGARLPVYALFAAAFFPNSGQNVVFGLYLLGIVAAAFTGLVFKRTLLPGDVSSSFLELPNYERPTLRNVLTATWLKVKIFVLGAGKVIVLVVAGLNVFNSLGTDGSFGHQDSESSVLSHVSQFATPLFAPMGIEQDNWPATVGIVTGLFAKEAVVGTLDSLYSPADGEEEAWTYSERFVEALMTIPDNLMGIDFADPLGIAVEEGLDIEAAAQSQEIATTTLKNLQNGFDDVWAAIAYLVFILMYMPCMAAMGALVRELGKGWAQLVGVWTTVLAYCSAVVVYQLGQLAHSPLHAGSMIAMAVLIMAAFIAILKNRGRRMNVDTATA